MYAVITEGRLSYLGNCQDAALNTFVLKGNSHLHEVKDIHEAGALCGMYENVDAANIENLDFDDECPADMDIDMAVSDTLTGVMERLDGLGINQELVDKIKSNGEQLFGEAKSLGVRGMKVVGEGFVALGDLLVAVADSSEDDDCGDEHCCHSEHGGEA